MDHSPTKDVVYIPYGKNESVVDDECFFKGFEKAMRWGQVPEAMWAVDQLTSFYILETFGKDQTKKMGVVVMDKFIHMLALFFIQNVHAGEPTLWTTVNSYFKKLECMRKNKDLYRTFKADTSVIVGKLCLARHSRFYFALEAYVYKNDDYRNALGDVGLFESVRRSLLENSKHVESVQNIDARMWRNLVGSESVRFLELAAKLHSWVIFNSVPIEIPALENNSPLPYMDVPVLYSNRVAKDRPNPEITYLLDTRCFNERIFYPSYLTTEFYDSFFLNFKASNIEEFFHRYPALLNFMSMGMRETIAFQFYLRLQLNKNRFKADTYVARMFGYDVVVKGPFSLDDGRRILDYIVLSSLKGKLVDLSTIRPFRCTFRPDQFQDVTGIGTRYSCEDDDPKLFLVWKSLLPVTEWPFPAIQRRNRYWSPTNVLDFCKLKTVVIPSIEKMSVKGLRNFIIACCWRYVMGLKNTTTGDFLWDKFDDQVYSIDEDDMFGGDEQESGTFQLRTEELALVRLSITNHPWSSYEILFREWFKEVAAFESFSALSSPRIAELIKTRLFYISVSKIHLLSIFEDREENELGK